MHQIRERDSQNRLIASGVEWKAGVEWVSRLAYQFGMLGFPVIGLGAYNSDKGTAIFGLMMFIVGLAVASLYRRKYAIIFRSNGQATAPYGIVSQGSLRVFSEIFFRLHPSMRIDEEYQAENKKSAVYEVVMTSDDGIFYKLIRNTDHDSAFLLTRQLVLAKEAMIAEVTRLDE
jgi:hypothetical protein